MGHLYRLSHTTKCQTFVAVPIVSRPESGKIDDLRDPENLKKFRAVKNYAASDEKHAKYVQEKWDEFVERFKKHTNNNHWFQTLLKEIDEYVEPSSAQR
jgi:hypothetical protein